MFQASPAPFLLVSFLVFTLFCISPSPLTPSSSFIISPSFRFLIYLSFPLLALECAALPAPLVTGNSTPRSHTGLQKIRKGRKTFNSSIQKSCTSGLARASPGLGTRVSRLPWREKGAERVTKNRKVPDRQDGLCRWGEIPSSPCSALCVVIHGCVPGLVHACHVLDPYLCPELARASRRQTSHPRLGSCRDPLAPFPDDRFLFFLPPSPLSPGLPLLNSCSAIVVVIR